MQDLRGPSFWSNRPLQLDQKEKYLCALGVSVVNL